MRSMFVDKEYINNIFTKKNIILYFIIYSFIFIILYFTSYFYFNIDLIYFIYSFIFLFIIYFVILYFRYKLSKQNIEKQINKDLPFFINTLSCDLENGIDLKRALLNNTKNDTIISKKIRSALFLVENKGYSLTKSLENINFENKNFKNFILQLLEIIENGSKDLSFSLKMISSSIIEENNLKLKKYSTKLNFITLIFIIISSIVPAMLIIFFLVGSMFFQLDYTIIEIIVIITIIFPILDMFLLFYLRSSIP